MPLPMVHLAVAVRICEIKGTVPSPDFLLGSIAPDAIHKRPGTGRDDKQRVHLNAIGPDPDHERIRTLLVRHWKEGSGASDFCEGYAIHLLTDRLWAGTVIAPFRERAPRDLSRQDLRTLYYQETDQIDFNLYHHMPWRAEVWKKLALAEPVPFEPLLTAGEIGLWRDRTLDWFETLKEEPKIEPVHVTDADVRAFIEQAATAIHSRIEGWRSAVIGS